jgi:hypothetical protein
LGAEDHLEGHQPLKLEVAGLEDNAHTATAQLLQDLVASYVWMRALLFDGECLTVPPEFRGRLIRSVSVRLGNGL